MVFGLLNHGTPDSWVLFTALPLRQMWGVTCANAVKPPHLRHTQLTGPSDQTVGDWPGSGGEEGWICCLVSIPVWYEWSPGGVTPGHRVCSLGDDTPWDGLSEGYRRSVTKTSWPGALGNVRVRFCCDRITRQGSMS